MSCVICRWSHHGHSCGELRPSQQGGTQNHYDGEQTQENERKTLADVSHPVILDTKMFAGFFRSSTLALVNETFQY